MRRPVRAGLSAAIVTASLIAVGGIAVPSASAATQQAAAPQYIYCQDCSWVVVGTYPTEPDAFYEAYLIGLDMTRIEATGNVWEVDAQVTHRSPT